MTRCRSAGPATTPTWNSITSCHHNPLRRMFSISWRIPSGSSWRALTPRSSRTGRQERAKRTRSSETTHPTRASKIYSIFFPAKREESYQDRSKWSWTSPANNLIHASTSPSTRSITKKYTISTTTPMSASILENQKMEKYRYQIWSLLRYPRCRMLYSFSWWVWRYFWGDLE